MPMGITNGNSIFPRQMDWVLRDLPFAVAYVHDILIGSDGDTEDELLENHAKHVRMVLDRLAQYKLVAKLSKAQLFVRSVEFCGHIPEDGTRHPVPGKLMALERWERPQTLKELRGFLGACNWYSQYIANYTDVSAPLHDMLQVPKGKNAASIRHPAWSPKTDEAFLATKRLFIAGIKLFIINPDKTFFVRTDASNYAVGTVLERVDVDGSVTCKPYSHYLVAFWGRKLAKGQHNWAPREKEAYAIIGALVKWAGWILVGSGCSMWMCSPTTRV